MINISTWTGALRCCLPVTVAHSGCAKWRIEARPCQELAHKFWRIGAVILSLSSGKFPDSLLSSNYACFLCTFVALRALSPDSWAYDNISQIMSIIPRDNWFTWINCYNVIIIINDRNESYDPPIPAPVSRYSFIESCEEHPGTIHNSGRFKTDWKLLMIVNASGNRALEIWGLERGPESGGREFFAVELALLRCWPAAVWVHPSIAKQTIQTDFGVHLSRFSS